MSITPYYKFPQILSSVKNIFIIVTININDHFLSMEDCKNEQQRNYQTLLRIIHIDDIETITTCYNFPQILSSVKNIFIIVTIYINDHFLSMEDCKKKGNLKSLWKICSRHLNINAKQAMPRSIIMINT